MAEAVEFGLLGPLEVTIGGRVVPIPAAKQRVLLACLLLRPGELVTADELAEAIWGAALPANPRRVIHTYVSRLRKLLGGVGARLQGRPGGYLLAVDADDTDLGRFAGLLAEAQEAARAGDRQTEAEVLAQALGLWRGAPLADVPSEGLGRDTVARLAEQRLEVLGRRIDADLALGRQAELVAELGALTQRYPLREQYWAQLLVAFYRCGRQADALAAYQRVRGLLAEELGIDPGPELQRLHQAILTNNPALDAPHGPGGGAVRGPSVVPSQLPADIPDLTGREKAVTTLVDVLDSDGHPDRSTVVAAVAGPAGVGKTALAVRVGHRLRSRFPDGQLYVNLRGAEARRSIRTTCCSGS